MKPFDLEAAKRGEPFIDKNFELPCYLVGVRQSGGIVVEINGCMYVRHCSELFMAPKTRTVWVNFYGGKEAFYHETEEKADEHQRRSENRIGGRAYPVEVEE